MNSRTGGSHRATWGAVFTLGGALALGAPEASATPITFGFEAYVGGVPFDTEERVTVGQTLTGSFSYDSDAIDTDDSPDRGEYSGIGGNFGLRLNFEGGVLIMDSLKVRVFNDIAVGGGATGVACNTGELTGQTWDWIELRAGTQEVNSTGGGGMRSNLFNCGAAGFHSDALPTRPITIGNGQGATFVPIIELSAQQLDWQFFSASGDLLRTVRFDVMMTRIFRVPEPATTGLLSLAMLFLAFPPIRAASRRP
jgi:hypothetical protein